MVMMGLEFYIDWPYNHCSRRFSAPKLVKISESSCLLRTRQNTKNTGRRDQLLFATIFPTQPSWPQLEQYIQPDMEEDCNRPPKNKSTGFNRRNLASKKSACYVLFAMTRMKRDLKATSSLNRSHNN
mmetsp:Transcript_16378/g.45044  ORF Transcript_16378/g.45044 Transcript_16378/m.45044 type:complete len:127 (-) Transcript_16378:32-412(-)